MPRSRTRLYGCTLLHVRTVLLIGAGATLAEALPTQPKQARKPPLDGTFFELCHSARLNRLGTVTNYMVKTYGIHPVEEGLRMEEVFNYLYADAVSPTSTERSVEAYWALIRMYATAIIQTTGGLTGRSRAGVGALVRSLWRKGERDITIVTFNQDLVIENALEETSRMASYDTLPWNIRSCYETDFQRWWSNPVTPSFTNTSGESLRILKLHGSLNWVYRVRSAEDARNALRQPEGAPACMLTRRVPLRLRARDAGGRFYLLPLIVPPIFEKSSQLRSQLASVWSAAEQAFAETERLIVFGYSFPNGDFSAISMVRRSFVANEHLNEISVINPDPHIAGKVGSLTKAAAVHTFQNLRAFLDNAR